MFYSGWKTHSPKKCNLQMLIQAVIRLDFLRMGCTIATATQLTSCCILGPELPAWLAVPTDSRPNKPSLKVSTSVDKRKCRRHKQASHLPSSASIKPEAAGQDHDNSGAEHLLDIWVSDSDEPSVSSKHRYMSPGPFHTGFALHSCK